MMAAKAMPRFTRLPLTLYRIQPRLPVSLRDYDTQLAKGRSSFDLKLHAGLVQPVPVDTPFEGPNGMSLRPAEENMLGILKKFKGTPMVYRMHEGLLLPESLVVYHEHTDHYSMQTQTPMSLGEFNTALTDFLKSLPPPMTREQFFAAMDDEDDQDN